jgi:hypothetical protein
VAETGVALHVAAAGSGPFEPDEPDESDEPLQAPAIERATRQTISKLGAAGRDGSVAVEHDIAGTLPLSPDSCGALRSFVRATKRR